MMKTTLLILLSGAFFAVVQTENDQITDTKKQHCPINEVSTTCEPCENFCNEEQKFCALVCRQGNYCRCATGYLRISKTNKKCVLEKLCSQYAKSNGTTNNPTIEPPKKVY